MIKVIATGIMVVTAGTKAGTTIEIKVGSRRPRFDGWGATAGLFGSLMDPSQ
jgi:hypothetical protein